MATQRPTITDVALGAGVSKGLVSFALNDRPGVAPDTRDRILAVAKDLGWLPSMRARSLSTDRSFALGLVLGRDPEIISNDPFFPAFIAGIEAVLSPVGQALVVSMVSNDEAEIASYRQLAAHDRVDGVILTDLRRNDPRIALVQELKLNAVTLGHAESSPFPAVCLDDGPGILAAVNHLVELGHRRIAHVAGPSWLLHGARRAQSFVEALRANGLTPARMVETDFTAADGARATRELLSDRERPTAIVYANDLMAIAGVGAAQRAGLRVPADLSVTGFDGSEIGAYVYPALTTVATSVEAWGRAAAEVLLRSIAGEAPPDIELAPARLLVRESTSSPVIHPTQPIH